jgi:hypothetical protein
VATGGAKEASTPAARPLAQAAGDTKRTAGASVVRATDAGAATPAADDVTRSVRRGGATGGGIPTTRARARAAWASANEAVRAAAAAGEGGKKCVAATPAIMVAADHAGEVEHDLGKKQPGGSDAESVRAHRA